MPLSSREERPSARSSENRKFIFYIKRDGNKPMNSFIYLKIIGKLKDLNQEDRNDIGKIPITRVANEFFYFLQELYNFLSRSTSRWEEIKHCQRQVSQVKGGEQAQKQTSKVKALKSLSQTRCSSRSEACENLMPFIRISTEYLKYVCVCRQQIVLQKGALAD